MVEWTNGSGTSAVCESASALRCLVEIVGRDRSTFAPPQVPYLQARLSTIHKWYNWFTMMWIEMD